MENWIVYVDSEQRTGGGQGPVEALVPLGAVYCEWKRYEDAFPVLLSFITNPRPMPVLAGISKRRVV